MSRQFCGEKSVPSEHEKSHKDFASKARVIKRIFRLAGREKKCKLLIIAGWFMGLVDEAAMTWVRELAKSRALEANLQQLKWINLSPRFKLVFNILIIFFRFLEN